MSEISVYSFFLFCHPEKIVRRKKESYICLDSNIVPKPKDKIYETHR
jgi:hypothetical protein